MADTEDALFAIEVDADDYAESTAGDLPPVSRTYQSEADFEAIKTSYTAKIDGGNTYSDLMAAVPALKQSTVDHQANGHESSHGIPKMKLTKKDVQLLGYAIGELYYDKNYAAVADLCERAMRYCEYDEKTGQSLTRWMGRCREHMS